MAVRYLPPPPSLQYPILPSPRGHTPPLPLPPLTPLLQDDLLMSWSNHEVSLLKEIGINPPPPFDLPLADWLAEFSICSLWLETSMPDRSAKDAYADAWIDYQDPPTRLQDFRYLYAHYSLFRELATLSSVHNIWPDPSR
jgi:hypothetical protein